MIILTLCSAACSRSPNPAIPFVERHCGLIQIRYTEEGGDR